jgi:uncharacterized membrane protein
MLGIANIVAPESSAGRVYGFKLAGCAVIAVLLAKERLGVLLGAAGFVAVKLGLALIFTQDWKAYGLGFLISILIILALLPALRRWKLSYEYPPQTRVLGILFAIAGIVAAVTVVLLLKPA